MTNCIFYAIFFTLFLNVSFGSLRTSQINRVFMSIYKGMLEASVITVSDKGVAITPYYNRARLNHFVNTYLKDGISRYTKDYTFQLRFKNDNNSNLICQSNCRKVEIELEAKINLFYKYEKTQVFTIKDGDKLWMKKF